MKQCSHLPRPLPACLLAWLCACALVTSAGAQERLRTTQDENFRQTAGAQGRLLSRVTAGTALIADAREGGWVHVTLDGWILARSVPATSE